MPLSSIDDLAFIGSAHIGHDRDMPPAFSLLDRALGKCTADLDLRIPADLKDAVAAAARARGFKGGAAEFVKYTMAKEVWGEEHVASLIAKELGVYGISAPTIVGTTARTTTQ
jgi:hypothetical protein